MKRLASSLPREESKRLPRAKLSSRREFDLVVDFFLHAFDYRRLVVLSRVSTGSRVEGSFLSDLKENSSLDGDVKFTSFQSLCGSADSLEEAYLSGFMELILRLDEKQFRPLFAQLAEWAHTPVSHINSAVSALLLNASSNPNLAHRPPPPSSPSSTSTGESSYVLERIFTFYRILNRLSETLKVFFFPSTFVPFFSTKLNVDFLSFLPIYSSFFVLSLVFVFCLVDFDSVL